ncbi:MAG: c-type cytochrome [Planctomycetaceae bacterium]
MPKRLLAHAEDADDHNLPLMYWYAIEPLVPADPPRAMELAQKSKIPLVTRYIIRRASESDATISPVVELLGKTPTPDMQQLVMDEMLASFEGRVGIPMPQAWNTAYDKLAKSDQQTIRDKADQLAILFGDQRVFPRMRDLLADSSQDVERRQQALNVLVRGQDKASASVLLSDAVLNNETLRSSAVKALSTLGNERVSETLLNRYSDFDEETRKDVISTLVSRPAWTTDLLNAIGTGHVPSADLHAYHVRQILSFNNSGINDLLKQHWGEIRESSADRQQLIADWTAKLTPDVIQSAHLGNGRRLFNKTCQNCHRLFGEGGEIGPDITGSNRANLDYILHNVLDPSAVIGRDYRMTVLVLDDGRVVSGLVKQESDSAVTIQTINDKVVVPLKDIEEKFLSDVSMMPDRQLDAMTFAEARDLIAYLGSETQVAMSGPPSPIEKATGKVPGAIEGEGMKIIEKTAGSAASQGMGGFPKDKWSGNDQLWWTGAKPGDRLSLEVPVSSDGTYDLEIVLTKARDYGVVSLSLDDKVLDAGVDCFNNPDVITTGVLTYRGLELKKGAHRLTLEITGANPQAVKAYMAAVDYVRVVAAAAVEE